MRAAVLALFSAFISFYTANRLLVVAFPVMLHHLLRRVAHLWNDDWVKFDPDHIFLINYNAWGNEEFLYLQELYWDFFCVCC